MPRCVCSFRWLGCIVDMFLQTLFVHPTEHYDFLVELNRQVLPRYHHNVAADPSAGGKSGKYANTRVTSNGDSTGPLRPGFDPAQWFFDDLKVRSLACEVQLRLTEVVSVHTLTRSSSSTILSAETAMVPSGTRR